MNKKRKGVTLDELGEMLGFVVEHMATKDDLTGFAMKDDIQRLERNIMRIDGAVAGLSEGLTGVEREMRSFRSELSDLNEKMENVIGYRKEIGHALERTAAIEKGVGLD